MCVNSKKREQEKTVAVEECSRDISRYTKVYLQSPSQFLKVLINLNPTVSSWAMFLERGGVGATLSLMGREG